MIRQACVFVVLLVPGCISLLQPPDWSCRTGTSPLFLVVVHHKDFYGSPEDIEKDRYDTVERHGLVWVYVGNTTDGSGRILGNPSAFHNVSKTEVLDHLRSIGRYSDATDFLVNETWAWTTSASSFDHLCDVLNANWVVPKDTSGRGVGCADGGSYSMTFDTARGILHREGGCLGSQTEAEHENQRRIDEAYTSVVSPASGR